MSDEIKKFFSTYTDFVTKVTSEPSIDLDALKKSFDEFTQAFISSAVNPNGTLVKNCAAGTFPFQK